jgi:hypothetical protein
LFLGDDSCGFNDALSLVKIGVGVGFGIVLPAMSLELLLVVSKFVRVFSVKLGCTVLSINASPFLSEKKPPHYKGGEARTVRTKWWQTPFARVPSGRRSEGASPC